MGPSTLPSTTLSSNGLPPKTAPSITWGRTYNQTPQRPCTPTPPIHRHREAKHLLSYALLNPDIHARSHQVGNSQLPALLPLVSSK